jgi:UDP-galactopyranose mutase
MTEEQIIKASAAAFKKRDKTAAELHKIDNEIKDLLKEYSLTKKTWGLTPSMLRHAVTARFGIAA